VAAVVFVEVYC